MQAVRIRIGTALVAGVTLAGALAACSSDSDGSPAASPTVTATVTQTATVTATPSVTPTKAARPASAGCATAEVAAKVKAGDSGAGQRRAVLVLTNTGDRTCTVKGYAGMQLVG